MISAYQAEYQPRDWHFSGDLFISDLKIVPLVRLGTAWRRVFVDGLLVHDVGCHPHRLYVDLELISAGYNSPDRAMPDIDHGGCVFFVLGQKYQGFRAGKMVMLVLTGMKEEPYTVSVYIEDGE